MCSVQDEGATLLKKEHVVSLSRDCMKCGAAEAVAIARTKDPFCKNCFHSYFVHRFRATFGKSRLVTTGERVLLAFSGGLSSCVLLALSVEGLSHQVHKRLRFLPTIIYIDEGAILGLEYSERCEILADVLGIATRSGFPVIFTQLEQVYESFEVYSADQLREASNASTLSANTHLVSLETADCPPRKLESKSDVATAIETNQTEGQSSACTESEGDTPKSRNFETPEKDFLQYVSEFMKERRNIHLESKLQKVFAGTTTYTAKENLLLSLRQQLLSEIAKRSGFHKVLLGVNATRLAVRLLSNVAQGRGATLPFDVGFADNRSDEVMFLRPLREFPSKEIATFVALHDLNTVTLPTLTSLSSDKSSIDRMTELFICGLQADFPSTVNTVFRTGDKLAVDRDGSNEKHLSCLLCQAPLTREADESVFSHLTAPPDSEIKIKDIWSKLCYGCRLTIKDMNGGSGFLPPFVVGSSSVTGEPLSDCHHSASEANRTDMKAQIKEFLLEDS